MASKKVRWEYRNKICMLTLSRPRQQNALDLGMATEFQKAIERIKRENIANVLVVTGSGGVFSVGADFRMETEWGRSHKTNMDVQIYSFYRSFLSITDLEFPTIAAIHGRALGAGAALALACDMRLASQEASIGFDFVKMEINPGMGSEFFLSRLLGPALTLELLMTGHTLTAKEAYQIGLINKIVASEKLEKETMDFAGKLSTMPSFLARIIKQSTYSAMHSSLTDVLHEEAAYRVICHQYGNMPSRIEPVKKDNSQCFDAERGPRPGHLLIPGDYN